MSTNNDIPTPTHRPLKTIRLYCLWCCNDSHLEVRLCPKTDCALYDYRLGKKTKPGSLIKIIKKKCLDCGEGTAQSVKGCEYKSCKIHSYRLGKNPKQQRLWMNRLPNWGNKKNDGFSSN